MPQPGFYIGGLPYAFPDAAEAIQAVAVFEASSAGFHDYDIAACNPSSKVGGYGVMVTTDGAARGWLREG